MQMLIKTFRLTLKPSPVTWTIDLVTRDLKFKITLRERYARDNKKLSVPNIYRLLEWRCGHSQRSYFNFFFLLLAHF